MRKKIFSLLLCACLILGLALPVCAEPADEAPILILPSPTRLEISSPEELLAFAESCRLDSYSQGLIVELTADISLSGVDFESIPTFSGSFLGNGHVISGLEIDGAGSAQGLFRYLTATATVQDLQVEGYIHPQGSMCMVGGIAGSNQGLIQNCSFTGTVSGGDYIGGIAGSNSLTGTIDSCQVYGNIHGKHFVGGIAGDSAGVIRYCTNYMHVNTTPQQNSIALDQITLDTLRESEAAGTVTDIGGVAGHSDGVIRACFNYGSVGYKHMGYNIGGIVGRQTGYVTACANHGAVSGRKEVGGIAGQAEPAVRILFSEDTLQILQQQLDDLSDMTKRASANAQGNVAAVSSQLASIQDQTQTALDAIGQLVPEEGQPLPDTDSLLAAQGALQGAMSGIGSSVGSISSSLQGTVGALQSDMQDISRQIEAMGQTLNGASETTGGTLRDVSDLDTPEDITGKLEACYNFAPVLADLNAGGIVGAISLENDLDPADDVDIFGEHSLNFEGELRGVILRCHNEASVTCIKQNAGGIAGWLSLGLVKDCTNTGAVSAEDASYAGGIAGQSGGFIRACSAKCTVICDEYAGGIAGMAEVVSDCRSMTALTATEKAGGVVGFAGDRSQLAGNYYLFVDRDPGAVDGISYDGCAQPLAPEEFLALEGLHTMFGTVTVSFRYDDGREAVVKLPYDQALTGQDIPAVPPKAGYMAYWDGLTLEPLQFDLVVTPAYTSRLTAIQSQETENDRPVLLAEGSFTPGATITLEARDDAPELKRSQTLLRSVSFRLSEAADPLTLRCLVPEGYDDGTLIALTQTGSWVDIPCTREDSYAVFTLPAGAENFVLVHQAAFPFLYVGLGAGLLLLAAALLVLRAKKRAGAKDAPPEDQL